jgi:pimeloyl-ACP methyl ester carboxylesterase
MRGCGLLGAGRVALLAGALVLASVPAEGADPLACNQQPGNRFFWLERAFCDLPDTGPANATGVILWNHGIAGTTQSWMAPAPPAFRLLQARGWDVRMLKRHHAADAEPNTLYRTVRRTLDEVAALKKAGYRKVALAGQSFGGYVTLEAIDTSPDLDAAIALSPGVRSSAASGLLDASVTDRILQSAKVGRLALLFPKDDALFNYTPRGPRAQEILAKRGLPYLLLDETSGISGHGGGMTGRFALRYGLCLAEFLAAAGPPPARFTCPPVADEWAVVRELLLPPAAERPSLVPAGATFPAPVDALRGPRWALLGDSLVLVALVDDGGQLRLLYRSTGSTGGVLDADVEGGAIRATLKNGATVTLTTDDGGTIAWTASNRSRTLTAPLTRGKDD